MFLIDDRPGRDVCRDYLETNPDLTTLQVSDLIRESYDESWFDTQTPSLTSTDNRLYHMVRSVQSQR